MIKKHFLIVCLILILHDFLMAQNISVDGIVYHLSSSDRAIIKGIDESFECNNGVLKLPSVIKKEGVKYKVKGIGELAFYNNKDIRYLVIPRSVDTIASGAFWQCHNLESVNMPNRPTPVFVDYLAFDDTKWYHDQPDGMTYIGKIAYKYKGKCPQKVVIAKGTKAISKGAFYTPTIHFGDYHLKEQIADQLQDVVIPKGVKYVSGFKWSSLKTVCLPKSVVEIGDNAFTSCHNLTNIEIPDRVKRLGNSCFEGCSQITEMLLPLGLEEIGERSFLGCIGIKELTIPDKIEILPEGMIECLSYAMLDASNRESSLKTLTLGTNVKKICKWALQGHHLESIICYAKVPPVIEHNEQNNNSDWLRTIKPDSINVTLYVPSGSLDLYRSDNGWNVIYNMVELTSGLKLK